jgi:hypothetical protein
MEYLFSNNKIFPLVDKGVENHQCVHLTKYGKKISINVFWA